MRLVDPDSLNVRSAFSPWFFPMAGPITALVWAQPRNRWVRWAVNATRIALVLYLAGVLVFLVIAACT